MKILITGSTGLIGSELIKRLINQDPTIEINALSRVPQKNTKNITYYLWPDFYSPAPPEAFVGIQGIIHLMGENIGSGRWSNAKKKQIYDSRVVATKNILDHHTTPPPLHLDFFISASAIGIYPSNTKTILSEDSETIQSNFLGQVCSDWEKVCQNNYNNLTIDRIINIRTGVVLSKKGGALPKMSMPFKLGVGGPIGNGSQMMSWIHIDDLIEIYINAIFNPSYEGPINGTAPRPCTNLEISNAIAKSLHRYSLFPVPPLALKIMFGEMSALMLDSQIVIPSKLLELGFKFKYTKIENAIHEKV